MMTEGQFYDSLRGALWTATVASTPILIVALVTGLAIGLFQALTSVQEMTLTFVPKVAAILITFWITMDFITKSLVTFFHTTVLVLVESG